MGVGSRIGAICKKKEMSLRKLSIDSGIPYSTLYSAVKRDSSGIDVNTVQKIAKTLGISWYELFIDDFDDVEKQPSQLKSYLLQKIEEKNLSDDEIEGFVGKDVLLSYYNTLNIDGKLEAYNILVKHATFEVITASIVETKQLANTPQYQKKVEE